MTSESVIPAGMRFAGVMDEGVRVAAKNSLDRMLEMASGTVGKGDLGRA